MSPEEALDLLPLLAADELDAATSAAVRAALAGRADAARELARWTELDGLLDRGLNHGGEARASRHRSPGASPPAVRCPYCRDAIPASERAICAECLTPHHRACFAENAGCSLYGCAGTRALDAAGCSHCREARPRRRRGRAPRALAAFAASLLLLLPGALGIGFLAQRELERTWWATKGSLDALEDEAEARALLGALVAAQRRYRVEHRGDFAPDRDALEPLLAKDEAWRAAHRARFTIATAASLSRPDERFFATVARGRRGLFANETGAICHLARGLAVDRLRCTLVAARPGRDPRDEERAALELALADMKERRARELPASERANRLEAETRRLKERVARLERGGTP